MEIVIGWFIFALIVGVAASSRGRSGITWFALSILISPLLSVILLALMPSLAHAQTASSAGDESDLRRCPACAELIRREAVKCKHCGAEVEPIKPKPWDGVVL